MEVRVGVGELRGKEDKKEEKNVKIREAKGLCYLSHIFLTTA